MNVLAALSGYSQAEVGSRCSLVSFIIETWAYSLLETACDVLDVQLSSQPYVSQSLRCSLEEWKGFPACWHSSLRRLQQALNLNDTNLALASIVEWAWHVGVPIKSTVTFESPAHLWCHGLRIPDVVAATLEGDGSMRLLRVDGQSSFQRKEQCLATHFELPTGWSFGLESTSGANISDEVAALSRSHELLFRIDPSAAAWIEFVGRKIVTQSAPDGMLLSESDPDLPGEIRLSIPSCAAALGETLVHECSHQYLHIAELCGPVHDGTDKHLYYSPFKRANRPIRALLVAFHAFGNVALMYESLLSSLATAEEDREYCAAHIFPTLGQLAILRQHLRSSTGITQIGGALWQPLNAELERRQLLAPLEALS